MKEVELLSVGVEKVLRVPPDSFYIRYHTQEPPIEITEDGDFLVAKDPTFNTKELQIEEIRWYKNPERAIRDPWDYHETESRFFAIKPEVKDLLVEHEGYDKNNMKVIKSMRKN